MIDDLRAIACDVFGTVVDWRSSLIRQARQLGVARGAQIDWGRFADAWRAGYEPAMAEVQRGDLPWMTIDQLHRRILDRLVGEFALECLTEADKRQLVHAWHRLDPWPDSVAGLTRLKRRYIVASLSNGNVALLVNMAKHAGLQWDCVLSAELFRRYKPDPQVYLGAAELLGVVPGQVLMVAAHEQDLRAARAVGLRTAYVRRPLEYGSDHVSDPVSDQNFDVYSNDLLHLATQLGI